jgi:hypothetical protein
MVSFFFAAAAAAAIHLFNSGFQSISFSSSII